VKKAIDWAFRSRQTNRLTIVQLPNPPLAAFLVASLLRLALHPSGATGTALSGLSTLSLLWWATDEVLRGVNPWRRLLGTVVLGVELANLVSR
jgi:hypothetical protein